jgi:asparagine synthase (glutamine-hydrolysing)
MCGINGILRLDPQGSPPDLAELIRTRDATTSRGPDGSGSWMSPGWDMALGHRRLDILDLSNAGLQPMSTPDGRRSSPTVELLGQFGSDSLPHIHYRVEPRADH